MRYFISTGEASGELTAVLLAREIRRIDPQATFEGIGGARMRDAGFSLWRDHRGWATLGLFHALPRIPKMIAIGMQTAWHVARGAHDIAIFVDFGAFHVRAARVARMLGYRGPILDLFPPGAWFDQPKRARAVAGAMTAVTAFEHQRDFYRGLGLPVEYFGHPLAAQYARRPARATPPSDAGVVALLPGSRPQELRYHLPALAAAFARLRQTRPNLRGIAAAADDAARAAIERTLQSHGLDDAVRVVDGAPEALADADAAWVASGTAVLEATLSGVPTVAFYIVNPRLASYGRRIYRRPWYTLPNLVLERAVVPELIQERATPQALAEEMDAMLRAPHEAVAAYDDVRAALGGEDALARIAAFAVRLAKEYRS